MHRPTRTRRLSIAAILSLVGLVVIAGAGVRSFWTMDELDFGHDRAIALNGGCLHYAHASFLVNRYRIQHLSRKYQVITSPRTNLGFGVWNQVLSPKQTVFRACAPIWPFLLLLLIVPVCWLIARPAATSAFPIITSTDRHG